MAFAVFARRSSERGHEFPGACVYGLLDRDQFSRLARRPALLGEEANASGACKVVVMDEIQKLPMLLDEVHRLIEQGKLRFLLTGSSARKLRRGGVNLLAGRKAISRSKLYLFDIGVVNSLAQRGEIRPRSELFGSAFEHFMILEVRAFLSYSRKSELQQYWRSTSGYEVDMVVGRKLALEVKSCGLVSDRDLKGLKALREVGLVERFCVVSQDPTPRQIDGIAVLPWEEFLRKLRAGKLL